MRLSHEPCVGVKVNSKRPGSGGEPAVGLLGDVGGVIVEDQPYRRVRRVGGIEQLEELDELAASMAVLDRACTLPVTRSIPASKLTVPLRLYSARA